MMTPKEVAIEIISKFENLKPVKMSDYSKIYSPTAKECAKITVNYIISANPHSNPFNTDVYSTMKHWEEVRKELELL